MEDYYEIDRVSNSYLSYLKRTILGIPDIANLPAILEFGRDYHESIFEPVEGKVYDSSIIKIRDTFYKDSFCSWFKDLNGTKCEEPYFFDFMNVACKMKMDAVNTTHRIGLEFKGVSCRSQKEFVSMIKGFDYDRQCFFYITGANLEYIMMVGVSKINHKLFKYIIKKGDEMFEEGRKKTEYLINYHKQYIQI